MKSAIFVGLLAGLALASPARAQHPSRDPSARFARDAREGYVAFLLQHRTELALRADQAARLSALQGEVDAEAQRAASSFASRAPSRSILAFRASLRGATREALRLLTPEQVQRARELRSKQEPGQS